MENTGYLYLLHITFPSISKCILLLSIKATIAKKIPKGTVTTLQKRQAIAYLIKCAIKMNKHAYK